jgi:hypothetical protein
VWEWTVGEVETGLQVINSKGNNCRLTTVVQLVFPPSTSGRAKVEKIRHLETESRAL